MSDLDNRENLEAQAKGGADSTAKAGDTAASATLPAMFLSSFSHSLDSKSRMVIPVVYREGLGKQFVIAPSLDFESIAIYPKAIWEHEIAKLYRKAQKSVTVAGKILEQFSAYSYPDNEVDSQGRVLIPARIKQLYLGDAKDVVVAGRMDHVLVKPQLKAEEQDALFMRSKDELLKQLDMIDDE